MNDYIYNKPWLSLGIANGIVAILMFLTLMEINPFAILFLMFSAYALFVSVTTENSVLPLRLIPGTKSFEIVKIDKKDNNNFMRDGIKRANSFSDPNRDGVFLGNAQNIYTPAQLEEMAMGNDTRIQAFSALSPLIPLTALEALSNSDNLGVLNAVASNSKTPTGIRSKILYTKIFDTNSKEAQVELLDDMETPGYILQSIYNNPHNKKEVALSLVAHPNTPKELFNSLVQGDNIDVLTAIAGSPSLIGDSDLINKIKRSNAYDVVEAVLTNPFIDKNTLDIYNPVDENLRGNLNSVVRNSSLELNTDAIIWIAQNAPLFKAQLLKRLKANNSQFSKLSDDEILRKY